VRSLSDEAEFIGAFSSNKVKWGGEHPDAFTWFGGTNRCDFTFRAKMFGGLSGRCKDVSNKLLAKGTWHLFEVELSKNSARYSVNGEVFCYKEKNDGDWPTSGYFGFVGYADEKEYEWRDVKFNPRF